LPIEIEKHIVNRELLLSNTEKDILELHPHGHKRYEGRGCIHWGGEGA
jgi:hypothetical protein